MARGFVCGVFPIAYSGNPWAFGDMVNLCFLNDHIGILLMVKVLYQNFECVSKVFKSRMQMRVPQIDIYKRFRAKCQSDSEFVVL